ncbi:MAG: hypothetical protein U9P14_02875, partial [Gemmatimonadota bacterium]|nr:hypothetical protein [Gemmatimonadota bacterium]
GTGSVPNFYINPGRLTYETTGEYIMPPVRYWPVGNDRTHSLAAQFNLRLPDDFQQGSALGSVLKNSSYFFIQGFGTGGFTSVRTPEALSGARVTLIDPNSLRGKSSKYTHLRLRKRFPFGKQMSLSAFCEIRNLIQWDSRKGYFPASNAQLDVIQKELSVGSGGVAGTSYIGSYKADRVAAYEGNPVAMQQARQRDYNKDGSISRSEQFVAERLNRAIIDGWNAGGTPRLWRFGFQFDF